MKRLFCMLILGMSGLAGAGELEDANKLLTAKAYDKALPIYAKLAEAGNTEAQFRLGEMYWYGDGTAVDIRAATNWMQKAAARGHAGAVESLEILKERQTRAADIAYWTSGYKGEDLVSGRYKCTAPTIPVMSRTNTEIKQTQDAYVAWQQCYNDFVANMNNAMPAGKRVPADVARLLTPREAEQVGTHLTRVYGDTIVQAQRDAERLTTQYGSWQKATEQQVASENKARKLEYDMLAVRLREQESQQRARPPLNPTMPVTPPVGK